MMNGELLGVAMGISKMAVLGAGQMGNGITQVAACAGIEVVMIDIKQEFVDKEIEPAVASYGHGFSLTPLKLAQLHALIANGGYLVTPHITRALKAGETSFPSVADQEFPLLLH